MITQTICISLYHSISS